ncbi:MAG: bifunctional pyr operon transcriptional regulator/uracil phosphoribosyltransferase PyrR [Gammaproteobacteria bacterium]|nr:bifunctional pyr operon transcriptional regulator/uracil phosphoribosyltransferase PyrR [Gammaproteobacteria bacterium]
MTVLDAQQLIDKLGHDLGAFLDKRNITEPLLVGVRTGGVWIAEQMQSILKSKEELGVLDITFYRDDFSRAGIQPTVKPSHLPLNITDRHIVLIDDVLYTGRTVRAALNEIFDYGRPASVSLAILVERNGRELPVQADVVGTRLSLDAAQHVQLSGPHPIVLEIVD